MNALIQETLHALRRVPVSVGLAIAIVMYGINGWWLDAGERVRDMLVVLGVAGFGVGSWRSWPQWQSAGDLWLGFMVGSAGISLIIGPGNLWPIVIVLAGALSAAAIWGGWAVGALIRSVTGGRAEQNNRRSR